MYTVDDAREDVQDSLDKRIRLSVKEYRYGSNGAYLRVYNDDPWIDTIEEELKRRGFKNIIVPNIIIKGDVYFEWNETEED